MGVLTCILVFISGICAFNIDVDYAVSFRGEEGTNFGYSAVIYNNTYGQRWVLVGATKANFTDDARIITPGNIYKCSLDFTKSNQGNCTPMDIRMTGVNRWSDEPGFDEDEQLLGASMAVIGDKVVTCAPLWKNMIPIKSSKFVHPIGRCVDIDRNSSDYETRQFKNKILKIETGGIDDLNFALAQIGFSVSDKKYEKGSLDILLGAPGFFQNKGGFVEYTTAATAKDEFFTSFTQDAFPNEHKNSIEPGTLMGYAITTGRLADADENCPSVIVFGAPHYSSSDGIVGSTFVVCATGNRTTTKAVVVKKQFFGRKSGSGFGTAIAFDDINGDGLDDLLVGAPLQYDDIIDTGEVYIYYGSNNTNVLLDRSAQVLTGSNKIESRFGSAIQCIGDLNKDGFNDIAVSAPYEDEMRGALYIYHGGLSHLTFTQKIHASDVGTDLKSFGWHISKAIDIDGNSYPDLLIGSYMSNTVTVLRTRPIIKLDSTFGISPTLIPLNSSGLQCQQGDIKPCVTISLCFSYTGDNVPDSILVAFNVTADVFRRTAKPSRVNLYTDKANEGSSQILDEIILVNKTSGSCVEIYAVVKEVNRDFYQSLEETLVFESIYGLSDNPVIGEVQPILSNIPMIKQLSANFSTGCVGICYPDLQTDISVDSDTIILDVVTEIVLYVRVLNAGDLSLGTRITIESSNNTKYIGYFLPVNEETEKVLCNQDNISQIQCDIPGTLFQTQKAIFNVRFSVSRDILIGEGQTLGNFDQNIEFNTSTETTSQDIDPSNNMKTVVAKVKLDSTLELKGISRPDQLTVSETADQFLSFEHRFDVVNRGPSPLHYGNLYICFPISTTAGKQMLYTDPIMITEDSPQITWKVFQFPGEILNNSVSNRQNQSSSISTKMGNTQNKRTFLDVSCETVDHNQQVIIQIDLQTMEKDDVVSFSLPLNISEDSLVFLQVSGIYYTSRANVVTMNDDKHIIRAGNTTYNYISSEIYPRDVTVETEEINIWIIVGSSIGGLAFLILVGVLLWKCGFFKREKKEELKDLKRKTAIYQAEEIERARAISTKISNIEEVDKEK